MSKQSAGILNNMSSDLSALESVLHTIGDAYRYGTNYVVELDSGRPGPSAGVIACTHGNEPAGLAAIKYLLSDLILKCGKLYFIIGNPQAAFKYFTSDAEAHPHGCRYIDKNLNRLPEIDAFKGSEFYEYQRAEALLPVLSNLDGVLDLHSTSSDAPPMLVCVDEASIEMMTKASFPFQHVITNINQHIEGKFLIELCDKAKVKILAECGQHESLDTSQRAVDISLAFLHRMGLIEEHIAAQPPELEINFYRAMEAVKLPQECGDIHLRQSIKPFELLKKGQVVACNGKDIEVTSPREGYAIMAPETRSAMDTSEALLFLCEKL